MRSLSPKLKPTASTRILVGSSDPDVLQVLGGFNSQKHQLVQVASSYEVLQLIQKNAVELIIFDLDTLGLDGILIARIIKNRNQTRHIPMILLYHSDLLPIHAIDGCDGCIDYLAKPFEPEVLIWKVQGFLQFRTFLNQIKHNGPPPSSTIYTGLLPGSPENDWNSLDDFIRLNSSNLSNQFAACLVHEIKNPMTTMHALLDLAKSSQNPLAHDKIDILIKELDRINTIMTNYLTINNIQRCEKSEYYLEDIIREMQYLLDAKSTHERMKINYELEPCPPILVNHNDITQLILNLALNGLEAMKSKGSVLTISTSSLQQKVVLKIIDQGPGIPRDILNKIWEPFYTTKSGGSGLGLAICRTLARRNNASISVESDASGTTFTVVFPPAGS